VNTKSTQTNILSKQLNTLSKQLNELLLLLNTETAAANAQVEDAALLALLKEWDEPGACGCDTATCRGTCLPARTRDAIAKATGERS